jgi:hypothetical protein
MKILDWVKRNRRKPGDSQGERVGNSVRNHYRTEANLPPQKAAWLIDKSGERHYHDIDIQRNGKPHESVSVTLHSGDQMPIRTEYVFQKETPDYLVYTEI